MPPRAIESLQAGAYRRPSWGPPATAMQADVDEAAQAGIDRRYARGLNTIAVEDQARGNPMVRAIEAQGLNREYEEGLPYGSRSRTMAHYGSTMRGPLAGTEVGSEGVTERPMGVPSIGQVRAIELAGEQARIKTLGTNPHDRTQAALDAKRGQLQEELQNLQLDLEDDVRAGTRSREAAEQLYAEAARKVQQQVEMLKPGFAPVNPFAMLQGGGGS